MQKVLGLLAVQNASKEDLKRDTWLLFTTGKANWKGCPRGELQLDLQVKSEGMLCVCLELLSCH